MSHFDLPPSPDCDYAMPLYSHSNFPLLTVPLDRVPVYIIPETDPAYMLPVHYSRKAYNMLARQVHGAPWASTTPFYMMSPTFLHIGNPFPLGMIASLHPDRRQVLRGLFYDPHLVAGNEIEVEAMHARAEVFDPHAEKVYQYLQVSGIGCFVISQVDMAHSSMLRSRS